MMRKQIYSFITIGLISLFAAACAPNSEPPPSAAPAANSASVSEAIAKAEQLFRQREDISKLREAVRTLANVRNPDARNFEVEWKFAKYNYFLGIESTDEKESDKAFTDGANAAQIAERLAPDKPDGYFWYGANLGEQADRSPVTVGIKSINEIRSTMKKVIEIQPDYQGASAYDALGQLEMETDMMGGTPEKAIEYLEKGLEIEKNNSYLRLHLAQAYLAVNRKADAKKQLEYILQMKPDPEYALEYKETAADAKKLLETKF
ncbi:MAG: TRAP transporter TatT component family protein [Pyrinomonadaceae bacterium]